MMKMNQEYLLKLLQEVQSGKLLPEAAAEKLKFFPAEDLGYAVVDHQRELRCGFPEVIYGAGKTKEQIAGILSSLIAAFGNGIMVSRIDAETADFLCCEFSGAVYHREARMLTFPAADRKTAGLVAVVCAGTSDIPVAEEAAITAEMMGARIDRIYDVGVAGIHRLFNALDRLRAANVIVVVAGMEAALGSVVGGLVDKPVIGVPTSVGYGAAFGGVSALLGLLNSCASGMTVVNIDNGFGAGYAASVINRQTVISE